MNLKKLKFGAKLAIGFGILAMLPLAAAVRMYTVSNSHENNKTDIIHSTDQTDAIMETNSALVESWLALLEIIERDNRAELQSSSQQLNSFEKMIEEDDTSAEELIADSDWGLDHRETLENMSQELKDIENSFNTVVVPAVDEVISLKTSSIDSNEENGLIDAKIAKLAEEADESEIAGIEMDSAMEEDLEQEIIESDNRAELQSLGQHVHSVEKMIEEIVALAEELIVDSDLGLDHRETLENMSQELKDIENSFNTVVVPAVDEVISLKASSIDSNEENVLIDAQIAKLDEEADEAGMADIEMLSATEDGLEPEMIDSLMADSVVLKESSSLLAQTTPSEATSVSPFTAEVSYIGDVVSNLSGGISKGTVFMGMLDVGISFETEKAGWWKGGTLFIHGQNTHGGAATESLVGDLQVLSNIENGNSSYLYEIWYQQTFGPVSVLFGKHDLNANFVASEYAGHFLNSAFGIHSSVALNVPVSIFPRTSLGVVTSVQFSDAVTFRMGVYDGSPSDPEVDPFNIDFTLNPDDGLLAIGELQVDLARNERHIGTYKIGTYYHSGTYDQFGQNNLIRGNYGIYGVADIDIVQKSPISGKGLSTFVQLGWAPSDRNFNDHYVGAGLNYFGVLKGRSDDVLGLAVAHAEISEAAIQSNNEDPVGNPFMKNFETAIELSYKIQVSDQISIQPDIQYILNPGLMANVENAVVALVRFEAQF